MFSSEIRFMCGHRLHGRTNSTSGVSAAIPGTPLSLTAHLGNSSGPSWLSTTGRGNSYTDWGLGASMTFKALTLGVQYVDTNTTFFTPSGKDAAKGGVVFTLGASF